MRKLDFKSYTDLGTELFSVDKQLYTSWNWQMNNQLRNKSDFYPFLQNTQVRSFTEVSQKFHTGVTPYYATLMNFESSNCPIKAQAVPNINELSNGYGKLDPLSEVSNSPVKEVVQAYPDRVAFCVAELCPVYCRYCFRKRRDNNEALHFNRDIVNKGIAYIKSNPQIRDVLITGGDPFIASDETIEQLLIKLKQIDHVEIIRFGTRTPVTLPYRITKKLVTMLQKYHPIYLNTHFNCAEEVTTEAKEAIELLVNHGINVGNQSVLLKGINDSYEKHMLLLRSLLAIRVKPYYLFHAHLVAGTEHLRVPVDKGLKLIGALRGKITGMGIPNYIVDTPGGKVELLDNSKIERDGNDLILTDPKGNQWREKMAFF